MSVVAPKFKFTENIVFISREMNISKGSMSRIKRDLGLRAYKSNNGHLLIEALNQERKTISKASRRQCVNSVY